jgi:hypothetical protein
MLDIVHDDELIIDYLTMVFGEFRGRIYEVAGRNKQLDEYLLFPRARHFRSKVTSAVTLRASTRFNCTADSPRSCAKLGTHFYFHSTELPVHFALHLDPGRQNDMPANSFHFTFDDVSMKNSFQENTGHSWCMQVRLDWNDNRSKDYLVYSHKTLDTIDDVYMPFLVSETPELDIQTAVMRVHLFLDAFLNIVNGLVSVYTQGNLLGQASLIPPFTKAIEFLYSRRSLVNDHFVKLNNEGLKEVSAQ